MTAILGFDLGKYQEPRLPLRPQDDRGPLHDVPTMPTGPRTPLRVERPGLVVFETCTVASGAVFGVGRSKTDVVIPPRP